jgi:hypothetical protein
MWFHDRTEGNRRMRVRTLQSTETLGSLFCVELPAFLRGEPQSSGIGIA